MRVKGAFAADDGRLELYKQGLNDVEIAEKMFLSVSAVLGWRHRRGLKKNDRRRKGR